MSENAQDIIRSIRDKLLAESDWTQMPDSPLSSEAKASWAAYRQQLRDLPSEQGQAQSSSEIVWPARP